MRYEITFSGRHGTESEAEAQEITRLLINGFRSANVSYNVDVWNT